MSDVQAKLEIRPETAENFTLTHCFIPVFPWGHDVEVEGHQQQQQRATPDLDSLLQHRTCTVVVVELCSEDDVARSTRMRPPCRSPRRPVG
jgi:hypothetical protein